MKPTCSICGWVVNYSGYTDRGDHCAHSWSQMHVACVESTSDYHRCGGSVSDTIPCVCVCHAPEPMPTDDDVQAAVAKLLAMEADLA